MSWKWPYNFTYPVAAYAASNHAMLDKHDPLLRNLCVTTIFEMLFFFLWLLVQWLLVFKGLPLPFPYSDVMAMDVIPGTIEHTLLLTP